MDELSLLSGESLTLPCGINVLHPTARMIQKFGEQKYFHYIQTITAYPTDYRVELYDMGIDAETLTDFELFLYTKDSLPEDMSLAIFDGLNWRDFTPMMNTETQQINLVRQSDYLAVDPFIFSQIVGFINKIHNIEKKRQISGNDHTKKFLIEMERMERQALAAQNKRKPYESTLAPLISCVANSAGSSYTYDECFDLPLYVLFDSVRRIQRIMSYENLMHGIYAGTIDSKKIKPSEYNWMEKL